MNLPKWKLKTIFGYEYVVDEREEAIDSENIVKAQNNLIDELNAANNLIKELEKEISKLLEIIDSL